MNKKNLTKLWQWISLGAFAYVVGSVISIQGGIDVFGAKLFADRKQDGIEVVAYFAVVVGAALLVAALGVALLYAKRHGDAWHSRIPVVLLEELDTTAFESKIFQVAVVVVLVLLPLVGVAKCLFVANEGAICQQTDGKPVYYGTGGWRLIAIPPHDNQVRLMKHDTPHETCGGSGVEIGWWTPIAFAGLPAAAFGLFAAWLAMLVRPKAKDGMAGTGDAPEPDVRGGA